MKDEATLTTNHVICSLWSQQIWGSLKSFSVFSFLGPVAHVSSWPCNVPTFSLWVWVLCACVFGCSLARLFVLLCRASIFSHLGHMSQELRQILDYLFSLHRFYFLACFVKIFFFPAKFYVTLIKTNFEF